VGFCDDDEELLALLALVVGKRFVADAVSVVGVLDEDIGSPPRLRRSRRRRAVSSAMAGVGSWIETGSRWVQGWTSRDEDGMSDLYDK
jgi:hypothetical protein